MKKITHGVGGNPSWCNCAVTVIYDELDEMYDMEIKFCKAHQEKDIRIMELLEQKRQLEARCKRLDEYDSVVDENAQLRAALESSNRILEGLKTIVDTKTGYLETSINQDYFDVLIEGNQKLLSDDLSE